MKELQLTILTNKELQSRYKHLENTNMARLTDEAKMFRLLIVLLVVIQKDSYTIVK